MSEFFKSAMGYFNTNPNATSNSSSPITSVVSNEFCGQIVDISGHKLRVKHVIAEGGFAFVYVAQDMETGKEYALKRLIGADKQACNAILTEINTHKLLSGHPNIVSFIGASFVDKTTGPQQRAEYLLLTELCKGGSLIDCLGSTLEPPLVLRIFYQASRAVAQMHAQTPSIAHRDIKIENFLIGNDKQLKLCDFGSATKETFAPTLEWSAQQRNILEDQLSSVTTPMYRPPEMLDTWSNFEIGVKVDIWALGCILYVLCFQKHPFEDSAKLRIVNGNYILPTDSRFNCFHEIIKGCLAVNPAHRFNVSMILERLAALAETRNWSLKGPLDLHGKPIDFSPVESPVNNCGAAIHQQHPPNESQRPVRHANSMSTFYDDPVEVEPPAMPNAANTKDSIFSTIRGGAGSLFKNLKDTSSKVMQTMQQTIARTDLDISYITSRVLVMPCPSEGFESAYKTNNIEDVRLSIESRFPPQKVSVYNFGTRTCPRLSPPVRTFETGSIYACAQSRAPKLEGMFTVAADMYGFLTADPKSIVIIQTADSGGCAAATMVCALLMYSGLILEPEDAVQVFAVKRHPINLRPSEFRYLYYFGDILRTTPLLPHYKNVNLISLCCQPVPRMTKARDGCRIYMEVYCNDRLLLSTAQDYEKLRLYLAGPGKISLPINLTICGDLTVVLYHARNALKGMVRPQGLKICQFQIHTGFIPEPETLINFTTHDLDDLPDAEQIPQNFTVSLSLSVMESECPPSRNPPWIPAKPQRSPHHLFSSQLEHEEMVDNFVAKPTSERRLTSTKVTSLLEEKHEIPILPDVTEITHDIPAPIPEPSPPIDLLNLNQPHPQANNDPHGTTMPTSDASFDLLGAFGDDTSTGIGSATIPDILIDNSQSTTNAGLDDIFGSLDTGAPDFNMDLNAFANSSTRSAPTLHTANSTGNFFDSKTNAAASKETSPQQVKDPFADIVNFASGLNINFNTNTMGSKSNGGTPRSSSPLPTHNTGGSMRIPPPQTTTTTPSPNQPHAANGGIGMSFGTGKGSSTNSTRPTTQPTSTQSGGTQPTQPPPPIYSTYFPPPKTTQTGTHKAKNADIFADILGEQGIFFGNKMNPPTLKEMREEDLIKDKDPNTVKIMKWTDGKKSNIRALLCSMHTVLWTDAKWKKCEMSTLITPADVKKSYRRACLAVHPDKHNGTENEAIAKLIFMELNNAWTDFENDTTQQNMFNT